VIADGAISLGSGAAVLEDSWFLSFVDCSTILLSLDNSASKRFQLELPGSTIVVFPIEATFFRCMQKAVVLVPKSDSPNAIPSGNKNLWNRCLVVRLDFCWRSVTDVCPRSFTIHT